MPINCDKFSKNIKNILADKNYLSYFIQFLDSRKALPLIKFWLDAESFRIAAENIRTELIHTDYEFNGQVKAILSKSVSTDAFNIKHDNYEHQSFDCTSLSSNLSITSINGQDSKCVSSDNDNCDNNSMTDIRDLSCDMDKPITDDEKSQLFEQNSKLRKESHVTPIINNENMDKEYNDSDDYVTYDNNSANISCINKSRPMKSKKYFQSSLASDAIRIFKKYLSTSKSVNFIDIPATILSAISLALCSNAPSSTDENYDFSVSSIFTDAQNYILERLDNLYLNSFIESSFYCKYCVDILTGENLKISDILHCEALLFYFMEFLEQENDRLYLDFWIAATNFKKLFKGTETYNNKEAQDDALILYEKYFSLQATNSLKMSNAVRYRIEERICAEKGPINDCFDLPIVLVERYLNEKYLKSFLTSNLFYKYISELLQKINEKLDHNDKNNAMPSAVRYHHRKTCKTNSSHRLISSQNSLLAMDSLSRVKVRPSSSDMHIESKQLYNPDLLWRRRNSDIGLQFGRINSLGRYERDFEMEPANNKSPFQLKESRIKQAVRKLVNLPEDKVQEEIAWQVAEMIVKDITNVTLNTRLNNELSLS